MNKAERLRKDTKDFNNIFNKYKDFPLNVSYDILEDIVFILETLVREGKKSRVPKEDVNKVINHINKLKREIAIKKDKESTLKNSKNQEKIYKEKCISETNKLIVELENRSVDEIKEVIRNIKEDKIFEWMKPFDKNSVIVSIMEMVSKKEKYGDAKYAELKRFESYSESLSIDEMNTILEKLDSKEYLEWLTDKDRSFLIGKLKFKLIEKIVNKRTEKMSLKELQEEYRKIESKEIMQDLDDIDRYSVLLNIKNKINDKL